MYITVNLLACLEICTYLDVTRGPIGDNDSIQTHASEIPIGLRGRPIHDYNIGWCGGSHQKTSSKLQVKEQCSIMH